jgi:hypothetical protein
VDQGENKADDHGDEADAEEDEEYGEEGLHKSGAIRRGYCEGNYSKGYCEGLLRRAAVLFLYKDSESGAFLSQKIIVSL